VLSAPSRAAVVRLEGACWAPRLRRGRLSYTHATNRGAALGETDCTARIGALRLHLHPLLFTVCNLASVARTSHGSWKTAFLLYALVSPSMYIRIDVICAHSMLDRKKCSSLLKMHPELTHRVLQTVHHVGSKI